MATAKIAITLDEKTLQRLDRLVKGRVFPIAVEPSRMPLKRNWRGSKRTVSRGNALSWIRHSRN